MGSRISDISRSQLYTEINKVGSSGNVGNTIDKTASSPAYRGPTDFTTSNAYQKMQAQLVNVLNQSGFSMEQATQLSQNGQLSPDQFARVVMIAQTLQKEQMLFNEFSRVLKTVVTRGKNITEGLKGFLDGMEEIIGLDTYKVLSPPPSTSQQTQAELAQQSSLAAAKQQSSSAESNPKTENDFTTALYKDLAQYVAKSESDGGNDASQEHLKMLQKIIQSGNPSDKINLSSVQNQKANTFIEFSENSMVEFPMRYHIDLFSYSQLGAKGVSLDDYLSLSSEIPPLRLLNLIIAAEKMGHSPKAIIQTLMASQSLGEPLKEMLEHLEREYGVVFSKESPLANHLPVENKTVHIQQGEALALKFLAFDTEDGILPSDKSSFVIFPQKFEYEGQSLNLSHLPIGVYMILAKAMNAKNQMMSLWMKVIVDKKDGTQKNQNEKFGDDPAQQQKQPPPEKKEPENMIEEGPAVNLEFTSQPINFKGPFLGEIVLPLDYLKRSPEDIFIPSPHSGIVIDNQEFLSGVFSNNAVTFRFLTDYIEKPNLKNRHALLRLRDSSLFRDFDAQLKKFNQSPQAELENWQKSLSDFFSSLTKIFSIGQKSFEIAREFFIKESVDFASGIEKRDIFKNESQEKKNANFLSAIYAKGSYALACAGDVGGALHAMGHAVLTDLSEDNHKAVLGEYLQELKNQYFKKMANSKTQNLYEVHISHGYEQKLLANPYYKPQGEAFIKAVDIHCDLGAENDVPEPPPPPPVTQNAAYHPGYDAYKINS